MSLEKWKRPALTRRELEDAIAHLSESEDDLEIDSDNDLEADINFEDFANVNIENLPVELEDGTVIFPAGEPEETDEEENILPEENLENQTNELKKMCSNVSWRKQHLILNDDVSAFRGNTSLPHALSDLQTPFEFFKYFFDDSLFQKIADESNLYSVQKDPGKPAMLSVVDIKKYLGICIYMSLVHISNVRDYWSSNLGFPQIKDTMSQKHFEFIRKNLHFNDNNKIVGREEPDHDRLHKLRPIVDALCSKFQSVPLVESLSVDEQLCATKARHHLKQYLPAKPHKWGYKLYVLCGSDGFSYNFEIYTGDENNVKFRKAMEPDLGSSANIVVRLCRIIPSNQNYRVYFDNFYTSLPLLVYLGKRGIYSLGTVRRPRIPNCRLPVEAELKKEPRGTSHEFICDVDGVDVSSIAWLDNKPVTFLSTFRGKMPLAEVRRWDRKQKKYINIECPAIVPQYNAHMGGVDAMDSYIGRSKIRMRSKKWYMRLFYHLLDLTLVNTWLIHKRVTSSRNTKTLSQKEVRLEIAECLCKSSGIGNRKRGRPSQGSVESMIAEKKKRSCVSSHIPPRDVRCDSLDHWPLYDDTRQRCKFPTCKSFSHFKCSKCGLHLCLTKSHNCFVSFHND